MDFEIKVSCKDYHKRILERAKEQIMNYPDTYSKVLTVIQVGANEQSDSYVKYKLMDCEKVGIKTRLIKLPMNVKLQDIEAEIDLSPRYCIIQYPIPNGINFNYAINQIRPEDDIDGFRNNSPFTPCTARGVMDWLKANNIDLTDKNVTMVGRGITAGKPLIDLLRKENCTLFCCNSHTSEETLRKSCSMSDIVISAVGVEGIIKSDMINPNTLCIDIGRGDFDQSINDIDGCYLTPIIGGVGLLTRAALIQNMIGVTYE